MNKVILIGRLTRDPEVKTTQSQIAFCGFTIAVDRKMKSADGERKADFISCVAWRQQAEFLGRYFSKGSRVAITGNLQSRTYDDANGKKVYVTEVVCDELEFVDSKGEHKEIHETEGGPAPHSANASTAATYPETALQAGGFYPAMDEDTTLPFDL